MDSGTTGLIGVIVGGIIGFVSSIFISRHNEKRKAAANLRIAFCGILTGIKHGRLCGETNIREYAQSCAVKHAIAIETFRFYIADQSKEE